VVAAARLRSRRGTVMIALIRVLSKALNKRFRAEAIRV
jgi:hypothetical protein